MSVLYFIYNMYHHGHWLWCSEILKVVKKQVNELPVISNKSWPSAKSKHVAHVGNYSILDEGILNKNCETE